MSEHPIVKALCRIRLAWWGVAFIGLITWLFTSTQTSSTVYTFNSVLLACMGAIALQLLQGTAGLASVGTAGFLLFGAFSSVYFVRAGVPFPVDVLAGAVVAGGAGFVTGIPAIRLKALFLALATLAVHFIALFLGNIYQEQVPSAASGGFYIPTLFGSKGLTESGRLWSWMLFPIVGFIILAADRLRRERSGRAMRMLREHEHIAPMLGVSTMRYKLMIFTLTSAVIGLEGGLMAHLSGNVSTDNFPILLAFQYTVMIVVGGLDSVAGAVIGAAIVVALPVWVPDLVSGLLGRTRATVDGPNIALIVYGLLVTVFSTVSTGGIVGVVRATWTKGTERSMNGRGKENAPSALEL